MPNSVRQFLLKCDGLLSAQFKTILHTVTVECVVVVCVCWLEKLIVYLCLTLPTLPLSRIIGCALEWVAKSANRVSIAVAMYTQSIEIQAKHRRNKQAATAPYTHIPRKTPWNRWNLIVFTLGSNQVGYCHFLIQLFSRIFKLAHVVRRFHFHTASRYTIQKSLTNFCH